MNFPPNRDCMTVRNICSANLYNLQQTLTKMNCMSFSSGHMVSIWNREKPRNQNEKAVQLQLLGQKQEAPKELDHTINTTKRK